MAQSKSGSFTGNGTKQVDLQIGFEPDVIVIDSGLDSKVAGYVGLILVVIARNCVTVNMLHNSVTDTNASRGYMSKLANGDDWGQVGTIGAYRNIASYANGVLTVTNATSSPGAMCYFIEDQTYNWTAYKA